MVPVEGAVDGGRLGEGRGLGEELEGEAVAGIVRVQRVTCQRQQLAAVLGLPLVVHRVVLVHPLLGLGVIEHGRVRCDTDLAAAELTRDVHHARQVVERVAAAGEQQRLVGHQQAIGAKTRFLVGQSSCCRVWSDE